ncbi:hypothetical protein [Caproicibacterium sp. XB2]|uniref:hypothetical protein n=1 Tax=Caproicibacterium sp. XB2 TaxID=3388458 RepID=UPI00384E0FF1
MKSAGKLPYRKGHKSLPTRERGLKLELRKLKRRWPQVAPYTGAWIEIAGTPCLSESMLSLPTRERGLKLRELVTWTQ